MAPPLTIHAPAPPGLATLQKTWFTRFPASQKGALRLFCLPWAGAGASVYWAWQNILPPSMLLSPVQLKGREARNGEPPNTSILQSAAELGNVLASVLDGPYVIWGHSMGALIAFETARFLRRSQLPMPAALILSGHRAPNLQATREPIGHLPHDAFIDKLLELGGISEQVLASPELVEFLMPTLRADFQACETYQYSEEPPLNIPIAVFGGKGDSDVPAETLAAWGEQTTSPLLLRMFPGGHFFPKQDPHLVIRNLMEFVSTLITSV